MSREKEEERRSEAGIGDSQADWAQPPPQSVLDTIPEERIDG